MIRRPNRHDPRSVGKPRASGDDPPRADSEGLAPHVNPARAGMIQAYSADGAVSVG